MSKNDTDQIEYPVYDGQDPQTYVNQSTELFHHPLDLVIRMLDLPPGLYGSCVFIAKQVVTPEIEKELPPSV